LSQQRGIGLRNTDEDEKQLSSVVAECCPQSGTLSFFHPCALMLLVGQQEGHLACKSSATTIHPNLE